MKFIFIFFLYLSSISAYTQSNISGQIIDAITNEPLKAAKIIVNGDVNKAVLTDKKGKFKIKKINPLDAILFVADGYAPAQVIAGNAAVFKVVLFTISPDKDVEVGYGAQSSRSLTSSVTVLSTNEFNKVIDVDIYSYLRGKVAGLHVIQNASNPSERPKIMLRGTGSLSGTYEPLIVIDGVQNASLQNLDPNDVASVTVLKDGSSQAMYGSQASGGVIIIKTKR